MLKYSKYTRIEPLKIKKRALNPATHSVVFFNVLYEVKIVHPSFT